ncbi:MAG: SPASM domain-containing protein [bacterium]
MNGAKQSAIFDIEEGTYAIIPLLWGVFLNTAKRIYKIISNEILESDIGVQMSDNDLISFLLSSKFAIKTKTEIPFKAIDVKTYDIPFVFDTLIIDSNLECDLLNYLSFLPNFRISRFVQLRLYFSVSYDFIDKLLVLLQDKGYYNIDIIVNSDCNTSSSDYHKLLQLYPYHLSKIIIMNYSLPIVNDNPRLIFNKIKMQDCALCGIIDESLISINIDTLCRYKNGNTCLWRKVSISVDGLICNCPSLPYTYGSIRENDILEVVKNSTYQKISNIKKSEIEVCKDCEFRVFCTDCRANAGVYLKPNKCKYNPYNPIDL